MQKEVYFQALVDLTNPLVPGSPVPVGPSGVIRQGPGNTLLSASGRLVKWYDWSGSGTPQPLGTWNAGTTIYDMVVSGDRVYLGLNAKGLCVLEFNRQSGFQLIGGDLNFIVRDLVLLEGGLWLGGNQTLPLECNDPLPTLVSSLTLEKSGSEVWVNWRAMSTGQDGGEFQLTRIAPDEDLVLGRFRVRNGEFQVMDPGPFGQESLHYRLDLCPDTGNCFTVGEVEGDGFSPAIPRDQLTFSPNPANPGTLVQFNLPTEQVATLDVYTLAGRHVSQLAQGRLPAGKNTLFWDGTDQFGRNVSSGIYLFALESETQHLTGRVVVAK